MNIITGMHIKLEICLRYDSYMYQKDLSSQRIYLCSDLEFCFWFKGLLFVLCICLLAVLWARNPCTFTAKAKIKYFRST